MTHLSQNEIITCKEKLLEAKSEILNRVRANYSEYHSRDRGGDETDLAVDNQAEGQFLTNQERLQRQLLDIEMALAKIEQGSYGFCEETEEPIEIQRLFTIPWTRLSVEGAEIREHMSKKFAK